MKSEILEILSNLKSSSSGTGMSFYSEPCGRRHNLKILHGEGQGDRFAADTGTVFHKIMELYYTGAIGSIILPYCDSPNEDDPVQEALRLFSSYRDKFSPDEWTTVAAEEQLEGPIVEAAVGESPYTARVDLVIHVSAEQARHLKETRKLDLFEGYYLVDHKTHSKKDSMAVAKYNMSLQFAAYHLAWNAAHPDKKLFSTIVNEVIRHVDLEKQENGGWRSFVSYFVEPPSEDPAVVRGHLKRQKEKYARDEPDLTCCIGHRVCNFYTNGMCSRL